MKKSHKKYPHSIPPQMPETMGTLASGIADDFNNILTTVMGACSLIDRNDPANGELLQYVALIRTSAERAADLTDRLMRASTQETENRVSLPHQQKAVETVMVTITHPPGGAVS